MPPPILDPDTRSNNLVNASDCFLLMIDVQPGFMRGLTDTEMDVYLQKYLYLLQVCKILAIPMIITAEDIQKNGSLPEPLLEALPDTIPIWDKFIYSCWGQANIREAIKAIQRNVAILCGFETDVCVTQTAIDLLDNSYRVMILTDLTFTRNETEHQVGLKRMTHHGAILSLLKTWNEEINMGVRSTIAHQLKTHRLSAYKFKWLFFEGFSVYFGALLAWAP